MKKEKIIKDQRNAILLFLVVLGLVSFMLGNWLIGIWQEKTELYIYPCYSKINGELYFQGERKGFYYAVNKNSLEDRIIAIENCLSNQEKIQKVSF